MTMLTDEQTRIYKTAILAFKVDAAKAEAESGWRFPEKTDVGIVTELVELGQLESRMKWVGGDVMYRQHRINESLRSEISAGGEDKQPVAATRAALAPASPTTTETTERSDAINTLCDEQAKLIQLQAGRIEALEAANKKLRELVDMARDNGVLMDSFFEQRCGGEFHRLMVENGETTFAEAWKYITDYVLSVEDGMLRADGEVNRLRSERSAHIMPDIAERNRVAAVEDELHAALWLIHCLTAGERPPQQADAT
jgi:hypothetical protein